MTIPTTNTTTTLAITCFNAYGIEVPYAKLKISLESGKPSDKGTYSNKAIFLTANGDGQVITTIPCNANLQFKLEKLDNKSTKGSLFNGTIEEFLELSSTID